MAVQIEPTVVQPGDHVVQFSSRDEDVIVLAGDHLADGLRSGDSVVIVARADRLAGLLQRVAEAGVDVPAANAARRLLIAEAADVLDRIAPDGWPDPAAFDHVVGAMMREAAEPGRPVRAYGDMVGVLWDAGSLDAAVELEHLWNDLSQRLAFSLFCAYPEPDRSGTERAAQEHAFGRVCGLHDAVIGMLPAPGGLLRPRLLARQIEQEFPAVLEAPRDARRFAVDTLGQWGWSELADVVELVVAELATNAVVHAESGFVLVLTCRPTGVRVAVRDNSSAAAVARPQSMTAYSGRGLAIVDSLATRWGVDHIDGAGKVLWAELEG